jgi:hypothetical protein
VVVLVRARPVGRLLLPVEERVRIRRVGLVDEQEDAAVRRVGDVDVVTDVLDLPAVGDPDRKAGGVSEAVETGG